MPNWTEKKLTQTTRYVVEKYWPNSPGRGAEKWHTISGTISESIAQADGWITARRAQGERGQLRIVKEVETRSVVKPVEFKLHKRI